VPADFVLFKSDIPILLPYRDPKTSGGSREKELPEGAHVKARGMIESLWGLLFFDFGISELIQAHKKRG